MRAPWNRLDPHVVAALTEALVVHADQSGASQSEQLAAALAAAHTQRQFMIESSPEYAAAVETIERFHEQTLAAIRARLEHL